MTGRAYVHPYMTQSEAEAVLAALRLVGADTSRWRLAPAAGVPQFERAYRKMLHAYSQARHADRVAAAARYRVLDRQADDGAGRAGRPAPARDLYRLLAIPGEHGPAAGDIS